MTVETVAIGKINIDISMRVDKLPSIKEHAFSKKSNVSFGGSAANFATQSSRLGVKAGLISCVGDDVHGQQALKQLAKQGVDTSSVLVLDNQPTGLFFSAWQPKKGNMVFTEMGANRFLEKHLLDDKLLERARTLHVAGGFPMMAERAAQKATADGMILSMDLGRAANSVDFAKILRHTDLLFVNRIELKEYFKVNPSKKALKKFAKEFPGIVILKEGKGGARATDGFEYCKVQSFDVPVVDTLGAGDAFAAGFVMAWTRSENITQALNVGCAVSAQVIKHHGAQIGQPTIEETAKFLKENGVSIDNILRTFRRKRRRRKR
ncbi:MAG: carbohydrate kinase family protein [Candidatus Thorarchaeota archaeon]